MNAAAPARYCNTATRAVASTLGVLVGLGSIDHGLLEVVQGNRPTSGLLVNALGAGYHWTRWSQGGEGAFTLIPNFLVTGLLATLIGAALILWSLRSLGTIWGPTIFLALSVASFLTGGGVAQLALFTLTWAAATRIRASLAFWNWLLPMALCGFVQGWWRWTSVAATVLFLAALEIAIVGYVPGVTGDIAALHICWALVLAGLGLFVISFVLAFAHDLGMRSSRDSE
jgi:hypothetical protein